MTPLALLGYAGLSCTGWTLLSSQSKLQTAFYWLGRSEPARAWTLLDAQALVDATNDACAAARPYVVAAPRIVFGAWPPVFWGGWGGWGGWSRWRGGWGGGSGGWSGGHHHGAGQASDYAPSPENAPPVGTPETMPVPVAPPPPTPTPTWVPLALGATAVALLVATVGGIPAHGRRAR